MLVSGWIYAQNTVYVPVHAYSASQMEGSVAGKLSGANRDLGAGHMCVMVKLIFIIFGMIKIWHHL